MPDSKQVGVFDRHTGAGSLAPGVSPLMAGKDQFALLTNCVTDLPGVASKRRGVQDLDHTSHYSSLGGLSTSFLPVRMWSFDNNLFVYLESNSQGAIAAYDMIAKSWQIVYAAGTKLNIDSGVRKVNALTINRTSLILTALGVYRLSALYSTLATSQTNYVNSFRPAGVVRALDPRCRNGVAGSGTDHGQFTKASYNWFLASSSVAYRVCWIYRDENGLLLTGAPSGKIIVNNTDTTNAYCNRLKIVIPAGLNKLYVLQIYRTFIQTIDATGSIPDPGDDQFLAGEYQVTSTDISNGYILYEDVSFDGLLGDDLYTNEAQDGEDQSRFQPPLARCVEKFGNCAWFGDVTERQRFTMKILAVDPTGSATGVRAGDGITVGGINLIGSNTASNETSLPYIFLIDQTTGAGSEVTRAIKTAESFVHKYNIMSNTYNGRYSAYNLTSSNDVFGVIGFEEKSVGGTPCYMSTTRIDSPTQILPFPAMSLGGVVQVSNGFTSLSVNGAGTIATAVIPAGSITQFDTISIAPGGTANASGSGTNMFAVTHIPAGEYVVASSFGPTITFSVAGTGAVASSSETLTGGASAIWFGVFNHVTGVATNAVSSAPRIKNRLYWSAPGEFESAPIVNFKDIGSSDYGIQSIKATTSSLFVMKDDGVWRVTGTDGDWQIEPMDPTCRVVAPDSPAVVAGDVYAYTANGIVKISESGVTKISTQIGVLTDSVQRTYASNPAAAALIQGICHPEDQAYLLAMPLTASPTANVYVYRYHTPSKNWSAHLYSAIDRGSVGLACMAMARCTRYDAAAGTQAYMDRLVVAQNTVANSIGIERRDGTFQEYCDFDVGYQAVTSYPNTTTVLLTAGAPASVQAGDVIWLRNPTTPDAQIRAPITNISTTSVARDTITIGTGSSIPLTSAFPAVGTVQAVFMQSINSAASYIPTFISDGFSTSHMSDLYLQFGSMAMFTDVFVEVDTDMSSLRGRVTMQGFAGSTWVTLADQPSKSASTMRFRAINCNMPQESQRAAFSLVTIIHNHAWEPFDLVGAQVSLDGEAKIRRNVVT